MINADVYLFDIDGTLLVTRDLVHWNGLHRAMLETFGVDTTIEGIAYHGKTDVAILRAALERAGVSSETFSRGLPTALQIIRREVSENAHRFVTEVCPGVASFVAYLRRQGKLLGIASGNLEEVGWHKVAAAGLRGFFRFGSFGDRCETRTEIFQDAMEFSRKFAGNAADVCFIGDTPDDILAARSVGAKIIAVCTGIFPFEQLAGFKPDACCRSCVELVSVGSHEAALDRA